MAWVLVGLQMEENSMTEREMTEAWVKKNKPKRYQHGERPEGTEVPTISNWGRRRKSKAESQAERDAEKG